MVFPEDKKRKMVSKCLLIYLLTLDQCFKKFDRAKKAMKEKNILK